MKPLIHVSQKEGSTAANQDTTGLWPAVHWTGHDPIILE